MLLGMDARLAPGFGELLCFLKTIGTLSRFLVFRSWQKGSLQFYRIRW